MPRTEELLVDTDAILALAREVREAPESYVVGHDTETAAPPGLPFDMPETAIYAGAYGQGVSVCLSPAPGELPGFYIPVAHRRGRNADPRAVRAILEALAATQATHLGHNLQFDWGVLEHLDLGYRPSPRSVDTQSARWLQDENAWKGLKVLGEQYLGEDADKESRELAEARLAPVPKISGARALILECFPELGEYKVKGQRLVYGSEGVPKGRKLHPGAQAEAMAQQLVRDRSWTDLTTEEMAPYAARDATMTVEVADEIIGRHETLHPSPVLARQIEVVRICYAMQKRGLGVDVELLYKAGEHHGAEAERLRQHFKAEHGVDNPGSDPQIQALLYDRLGLPIMLRTDSGAPSVAKTALEQLQGHPVAKAVLEYRRHVKAKSTYADGFAKYAERSHDGRIHGSFRPEGTVTGRLSSSGPNMQNIPRGNTLPDIRRAFERTDPGIERTSFDLVAAELWVTASLTQDPVLTEVLMSGESLHLRTMKEVFGFEDKEHPLYTVAKNVNYSIQYGAGIEPLVIYAATAGYAPDEARRIAYQARDGHKNLFARQHMVSERLGDKARELGYLPLHIPGRARHFRSPNKTIPYYTALSALVQGGVGEFMKDVMIEVDKTPYGELLILQIHDELTFDHPVGMREEIAALLKQISYDINPFRYPLEWDSKVWSTP